MLSKRKQVYLAVAGSVAIHLAVLFAWALSVQWFPKAEAAPSQPPEEIKLQVVEEKPEVPPQSEPTPTPPKPKLVFADTDELPEASQAPKDSAFQSARNTEAASELPASGDKPLPTQKGKQVPRFAFDTHPFTPGDEGRAAGQNVPENMPPPLPATAPPPPRPVATPPPVQATPTPAPTTAADPRDLAMVTPTSIPSTPADAEPNPYDPSFRPPSTMTEPPRPTPVPRRGGYRPLAERTDANGSIGKNGVSSVSSEGSPAGRYIASVKQAIDRRYRQYVDARADMITLGLVKIHFTVDRDGKVCTSHVVSNSANEALAAVSLRAVSEARIPPMPTEVVSTFDGGILDMSINFTLEN